MKQSPMPPTEEELAALRRRLAGRDGITLPLQREDLLLLLKTESEHEAALRDGVTSEQFFGERYTRVLAALQKKQVDGRALTDRSLRYLEQSLERAREVIDGIAEVLTPNDGSETWRLGISRERPAEIAEALLPLDRALEALTHIPRELSTLPPPCSAAEQEAQLLSAAASLFGDPQHTDHLTFRDALGTLIGEVRKKRTELERCRMLAFAFAEKFVLPFRTTLHAEIRCEKDGRPSLKDTQSAEMLRRAVNVYRTRLAELTESFYHS